MVAHARWCSSFPVTTAHGHSRPLVFQSPVTTTHGRSRPLVFVSPVRTAHGPSRPLVFVSPVRTAHGPSPPLVFVSPVMATHARTAPFVILLVFVSPLVFVTSIPDEGRTWSLTLVGVCVSGEDCTWSLMPIGASIPDEDHTWSLTFTRVPFFGEDCSWSATPEPTPVFSFNSPLHHASKKAVVKGRIMSWT